MALFSKKVAVNVGEVVGFRENVATFAQTAHNVGDGLVNSLAEMEAVANQRANALERVASSYEQLYSSIKQLERSTEQRISSLKTQLSHTPKELEKKSTDGNGNVKVSKSPNPEYKALESEMQREHSKLCAIKELSWKVYNEVSHSRRTANELAVAANELKNIIPELQRDTRALVFKTDGALHSLENTIRTINYYLSFRFHI